MRNGISLVVFIFFAATCPLWAGGRPRAVSPGGEARQARTAASCPTFHWSLVDEAQGYELIVYRAEGRQLAGGGAFGVPIDHGAPALRELLPAGVTGWAPSLDRCLDPGGRYAWMVRALDGAGMAHGEWSEPRHFEVRPQSRLERLLGKVVKRLVAEGELSDEEAAELAAWGVGAGATGDNGLPESPLDATQGFHEASPSVPGPQTRFVNNPGSAAFQVDGAGYERGIYVEGDVFGILSNATNPTGFAYGLRGASTSTSGRGVLGIAYALSGSTYGVYGHNNSTSGRALFGWATATTGFNTGVWGESNSKFGKGVYGLASATNGSNYGVEGQSDSTSGVGVLGFASAFSGTNTGVYGATSSASGYSFYAAGSGTNYGPFTGGHEARLADGFGEVVPGMVVVATGETQVREENGAVNLSSTLPTVALSRRAEDPAVLGVLVAESELSEKHWYKVVESQRFATVNALGEGRVWVTDANGPARTGDYLTTSDVPGYAQRQEDRFLQSHTLGKAIETVDWDEVTDTVEQDGKTYKRALIAVVYTSG